MEQWIGRLRLIGTIIGVGVITCGLILFFAAGELTGLLIALAIVIVGPVEDILKKRVRKSPGGAAGEAWATVVDLVTSIAFLVLLGCVLFLV